MTAKHYVAWAVWVLSLAATSPAGAQAQNDHPADEHYYYRFDEKVPGRIDTSILALRVAPGRQEYDITARLRASWKLRRLDEQSFVEPFEQEGIVFFELGAPLDRQDYERLRERLVLEAPDALWGHPFFAEDADLPWIITDELVVRFRPDSPREAIEELHRALGVEVVEENPHVDDQYLLRVRSANPADTLEAANRYQESGLAVFSHPNFLVHIEYSHNPTDTDYSQQWHLHNGGGGGMTADADIDTQTAWDVELGDPDVVVAVIDGGFEVSHPDLDDNYLINTAEIDGNSLDDDGNGYVDDVDGWSFVDDSDDVSMGLWPYHGQSVAGLVAAEENGTGVVGVCPGCTLLLIANTFDIDDLANAFYYARDRGADIVTNSWGATDSTFDQPALVTALADLATNGRGGLGIPIYFASGNDGGGVIAHPARDPSTIAIGGSDCTDTRYTGSQYGDGLSVVSPTRQGDGTCGLVTTGLGGGVELTFGGTSGATPIAAGVAGLALSAEPGLSLTEVQRLLRDSADKTEDSAASYDPVTGFSQPAVAPVPAQPGSSHGWGRVNADEALHIVGPVADGGRGGKDVFLRDNRLDWGNTEQLSSTVFEATRGFLGHWRSVDIKVDAPPYQTAPTTSVQFDALTDEDPRSGADNRVYVRVRNRGPETVTNLKVSLHWAFAGTALPPLPASFWTQAPGVASDANWTSLGAETVTGLSYSGASVAGCPGRAQPPCGGASDDAAVVQFVFPGPAIDMTQPNPRHYCVFAVLHTSQDPVSPASQASLVPDWITPRDNNVTHRNLVLQDAFMADRFSAVFYVRNPTRERITTRVDLDLPPAWREEDDTKRDWILRGVPLGEPFEMEPGEQILVTLLGSPPRERRRGLRKLWRLFKRRHPDLEKSVERRVTVIQTSVDSPVPFRGGITFVQPEPGRPRKQKAGGAAGRPGASADR